MARGKAHQDAKLEREKKNNVTEKKTRDALRPFGGAASEVKEVTGKMPEGSRRGPTPAE